MTKCGGWHEEKKSCEHTVSGLGYLQDILVIVRKCNFLSFKEIMSDRPANQSTDRPTSRPGHREVTLPNMATQNPGFSERLT